VYSAPDDETHMRLNAVEHKQEALLRMCDEMQNKLRMMDRVVLWLCGEHNATVRRFDELGEEIAALSNRHSEASER
jgi:hypothetical protein